MVESNGDPVVRIYIPMASYFCTGHSHSPVDLPLIGDIVMRSLLLLLYKGLTKEQEQLVRTVLVRPPVVVYA
jgi:hypothetical protein